MNIKTIFPAVILGGCALGLIFTFSTGGAAPKEIFFKVYPIGTVRKKSGKTFIEIKEKYKDGLLGLDEFSHVQVFWWFDRNDTPKKRSILQVHPRGNPANPLRGVFATRAPVRPNLIALTTCKILSIEGSRIYLDNIDAFDNTPVLDLKPYMPGLDAPSNVHLPQWVPRHRRDIRNCPPPLTGPKR